MFGKHFFLPLVIFLAGPLTGCSTNPATGESQFTALMSPEQEVSVGAQEHENVLKQYGLYDDKNLQNYVQSVGHRVTQGTERADVEYKFYLLDSPMINAFALPGGYIYLTRGLMALSNSEAEMAAVLAHETGHITARHSAERYSRGMVTSLGTAILSSAIGDSSIAQALGLGNDLYIKSYSRGQESQADGLGIRYLSRAGYDPRAMAGFLSSLNADSQLEASVAGQNAAETTDYFSTHPATAERVVQASTEAGKYLSKGSVEHEEYLKRIDGMVYGDSAAQGFVRGQNFYHPQMGFTFAMPPEFKISNQPDQVIASSPSGALIVFDMVENKQGLSPMDFLTRVWTKGEPIEQAETLDMNGMSAATGTFEAEVNGKSMQVRLIAIEWNGLQMARFLMAIPPRASQSEIENLQRATYSFRHMSDTEKASIRPYRLRIVTARAGDSAISLSQQMALPDNREEHFRVLNGLHPGENITTGQLYKIVVD